MAGQESYLTSEGAQKIKEELEQLKTVERDDISKRLRAAIEMGDLSENADYIKAKEDQGFLEGRIMELESVLRNAVIIDDLEKNNEIVGIGDIITIQEEDFPEEKYHLVGPKEADPSINRISNESPIGKALLGHSVGETVKVSTPNGEIQLKITKIE